MRDSVSYRVFSIGNIVFFLLLAVTMVFPLYKVFITSIITAREYYSSPLILLPKTANLDAYRFIFSYSAALSAIRVTVFVTVVGTFLSMLFTLLLSYALSKSFLPGCKIIHRLLLATMFISPGLIPFYMLVRSLGLTNTIWVNIIPGLISLWNYLVIRSFFRQLPASLEEAALIDGAGWGTVFFRIVIPLSLPVIATFTLFYAVGYWNAWWNAMLFCSDPTLQTLQLFLRRMIVTPELLDNQLNTISRGGGEVVYSESIKMAAVMVATVPILAVYPFLQRYFTKGVMIGAIKG